MGRLPGRRIAGPKVGHPAVTRTSSRHARFDSWAIHEHHGLWRNGSARDLGSRDGGSTPSRPTRRTFGAARPAQPVHTGKDPGSNPGRSTRGSVAQRQRTRLSAGEVAGSSPVRTAHCPCGAIGERTGFRSRGLQVRVLPGTRQADILESEPASGSRGRLRNPVASKRWRQFDSVSLSAPRWRKLVDAPGSGSGARCGVRVRVSVGVRAPCISGVDEGISPNWQGS